METTGYVLCSLIGVGLVYSLVVKVDVRVPCEGSLDAVSVSAVAPTEAVVVEWMIQPGQKVNIGAPLCSLAIDPLARGKARARYSLKAAVESLAAVNEAESQAAAAQARAALDALGAPRNLQTLNAPGSGIVSPTGQALRAEVLEQGAVVARIMDASRLEMTGMVPVAQANNVASGNPARVLAPVNGVLLEGRVVGVSNDTPGKVTLQFEPVPESLQQTYVGKLLSSEVGAPENMGCKAEIVVGRTSLFRNLFGRH
jgi:hypothetical protein